MGAETRSAIWHTKCKTAQRKETWYQLQSRRLMGSGRSREGMNMQTIKKFAVALVLTLGFVVVPGLSSLSTVQAQGWGYGQGRRDDRRDDRWDDRNDRWGRNGSYRDEQ